METVLNKPHKFSITLKENNVNSCTYRVNRKLFDTLKKYLEPFRSLQPVARKVKCIETGTIFNSPREASHWLKFVREISYCNMDLIKNACRRKGTSFGYHWEFVD